MDEHPAEKAKRLGVPLIPPKPPAPEPQREANPTVAVCGECGREVKQLDGYACPRAQCPLRDGFSW